MKWYVGVTDKGVMKMFSTSLHVVKRDYPNFKYVVGPFFSSDNAINYIASAAEIGRQRMNPGTEWHKERMAHFEARADEAPQGSTLRSRHEGSADAHYFSMREAKRLGMNPKQLKRNPPHTVIYDRITAIEAQKGQSSLWPNEHFRHDFKEGGKVIGLHKGTINVEDGDLLIKKGRKKRKLWKNFSY